MPIIKPADSPPELLPPVPVKISVSEEEPSVLPKLYPGLLPVTLELDESEVVELSDDAPEEEAEELFEEDDEELLEEDEELLEEEDDEELS